MTSIEKNSCVTENFAVSESAMYTEAELADKMCCVWGGQLAIPSAVQSTGVAYYYKVK